MGVVNERIMKVNRKMAKKTRRKLQQRQRITIRKAQTAFEFIISTVVYIGVMIFVIINVLDAYTFVSDEKIAERASLVTERLVGTFVVGEGDPLDWWNMSYENVSAAGLRSGTDLDFYKIRAFAGEGYGESRRQMNLSNDYRISIRRLPTIMVKIVLENPLSSSQYNSFDKGSALTNPANFSIFSFENGTAVLPKQVYVIISNDTRSYLLGPPVQYGNAYRMSWDLTGFKNGCLSGCPYKLRVIAINGDSFGQASVGVSIV